jgi:predicted regulator of Ras-like GTPase activity (Roadblock/LC7/MglB family)
VNGYGPLLERITRVPGVRGAMLVSVRDGLMVSDHLVEGLKGTAVAALAASLAQRVSRVLSAAGAGQPAFWHLHASDGGILAVAAPDDLLVVAVTAPDVNAGLVRLELRRAAEAVT